MSAWKLSAFTVVLSLLAPAPLTLAAPTKLATHQTAKPTAKQMDWLDLEVASMITWNVQTICSDGKGNKPYSIDDSITDQACQVAR